MRDESLQSIKENILQSKINKLINYQIIKTMERENYLIENAIVTDVKHEGETGRIVVTLNQNFKSIDFKTGEDIETDTFSIDKLALSQQLVPICDELEEADLYSCGEALPFVVLKTVMKKALVNIERVYKKKGELRENKKEGDKDSVYTSNLYKSVFKSINPNMSDAAKRVMSKQLDLMSTKEERVIETRRETMVIRPPFSF